MGFRVYGLGFRVQDLGFRVQGSGFRVWGLGVVGDNGKRMETIICIKLLILCRAESFGERANWGDLECLEGLGVRG